MSTKLESRSRFVKPLIRRRDRLASSSFDDYQSEKPQNWKLILAANSGDHEGVTRALEEGVEITFKDWNTGEWGLHAALQNFPDIIAELLVKKADLNIMNNFWKNAIKLAHENNYQDAVKLLEAWGDREALNQEVLRAAKQGRGRLISGLLRAGADLQYEDGHTVISLMNTGLMIAATEGSARIGCFIRAGADVQTRDETGETGLDKAVKGGHRAAAEAFLDHGITGYNREECLQQCDNNRERINQANKKLISASGSGDDQKVEEALEQGAEINKTDQSGKSGLHQSAKGGHQNVVLTLLNRGLDPNIRGPKRITALMGAAKKGHLPCVQTLLEHGALTDLQDVRGDTALMKAAEFNYLDIAAELLARQADVNIKNDDKKTALQFAEEKSNQDVVRILRTRNNKDNLNKEMLAAAGGGRQRLVHALITAGADLETRDQDNNTALHLSAYKGHESVVRILLQHGIDVNSRDKYNSTPLIDAAYGGQHMAVTVTKLLMRSGVDLNLQDEDERTALMFAAYMGLTSLVCELLEAGADRDIKDKENMTVLQLAQKWGFKEEIVKILERGKIQADDGNAARAVLVATEAGCPNVVSDLLKRGASMDATNDMGDTPFQIAARLPKTRKDEFEDYLQEVDRKKEIKPTETKENVVKEAEEVSRELAKVILSQSLNSHDPVSITKYLFDIVNFVKKDHFNCTVFGDEQKFYLKYDKKEGKDTLLESVVDKGMVKDREEVLGVMKKVDLVRYPNKQEDADYRLKKQVQKACSSSVGLRDCIQSIDEKYPWSNIKHKFKVFLSFFIFFMGTMFYGLDIYTDIRFSLHMFNNAKRNFTQEQSLCLENFEQEFTFTIEVCRDNFNMTECVHSLSVVKKMADDCFDNEERFKDPNDWWIAGTVSSIHCALPILIGFILWGVLQIGEGCDLRSLQNLPLPFVTRWFKFRLDVELFSNYAWPDRNKSPKFQIEYEAKVEQCSEDLDANDQIVNLSMIIESSVEASFQFFFQTVYVLPTLIISFTDVSVDWKDLFNWKTFSIVLSFASFAWAFYVIRYKNKTKYFWLRLSYEVTRETLRRPETDLRLF